MIAQWSGGQHQAGKAFCHPYVVAFLAAMHPMVQGVVVLEAAEAVIECRRTGLTTAAAVTGRAGLAALWTCESRKGKVIEASAAEKRPRLTGIQTQLAGK